MTINQLSEVIRSNVCKARVEGSRVKDLHGAYRVERVAKHYHEVYKFVDSAQANYIKKEDAKYLMKRSEHLVKVLKRIK